MKQCSKCKQLKDESEFSKRKASRDGLSCWCKSCYKTYNKEHKEENRTYTKKWRKEHPERRRKSVQRAVKKWKTKNPKIWGEILARCKSKRQRDLGWELLYPNPFDECEEVEGHHINDIYVVYLPKDLHLLYNGIGTEAHRINLSYIVEQIYENTSRS